MENLLILEYKHVCATTNTLAAINDRMSHRIVGFFSSPLARSQLNDDTAKDIEKNISQHRLTDRRLWFSRLNCQNRPLE